MVPVCSPTQEGFDCFILVCENLEWDNPTWEFLKEPIQTAAKVKVCFHGYWDDEPSEVVYKTDVFPENILCKFLFVAEKIRHSIVLYS